MMLVTIRPGPTPHLWRGGQEVARVPLTPHAALALAESLLREARAAMVIRARAEIRLAEEYDAAQARGEVAGHGGARNFKIPDGNLETCTADLGMRSKEIHEARRLRDAARARGEVARNGQRGPEKAVGGHNSFWRSDCVVDRNAVSATAADLAPRRDEIYEARQ
jgi:hypothetical protein